MAMAIDVLVFGHDGDQRTLQTGMAMAAHCRMPFVGMGTRNFLDLLRLQ